MYRGSYVVGALVAVLLTGCESHHYDIEMKPRGPEVERTITAWRVAGDKQEALSEQYLESLARQYPHRLSDPGDLRQTFRGEFSDRLPEDVGGAGWYLHFESDMGVAWIYTERFRGDDGPAKQIEEQFRQANLLADQLVGWFTAELENEAGFEDLRKFLQESFREDLKNLATYAWMSDALGSLQSAAEPGAEMTVRAFQYLAERGYLSTRELPNYTRKAIEAFAQDRPETLLALFQRQVATRMGVPEDQPIPASLGFLGDPQAAQASLETYLKTTPQYRERMAQWDEQKNHDPDAAPPEPLDVLADPQFIAALLFVWPGRDRLEASLATGTEPWLTNGSWDAQAAVVRWSAALTTDRMPVMCYAMWATPDETQQRERFGQLVFKNAELLAYCLWHESLTDQQADEWDGLMNSLRPGPELGKQLAAFRFSGEPDNDDAPPSYAEPPVSMIREALESDGALTLPAWPER
jgi:hypothetical protein